MAITAKVRNKQIDTGKVLHALVQGEHASGNITFQIIGEEELVEDFNSTYFYLLYTRPSDTRPNVLLLTNKQLQDDVISVTFKPTSYFTAEDGTVQIQIMATDTEGLSIDSETGTISGSVIWQTFPGAMFVHASQLTGTETIIEENVLTQYLAGMQELYSQTEDAEGDAADYAQLAKDWASKTNGAVEGGEMSAKYYAGTADSRAKEAEGYAVGTVSGSPSASFAGKNAKELASDAQDWAKGTRSDGKTPSHTSDNAKAYAESAADSAAIVSAHAEAIDAIGDDLTNIDAVAADILDDDSAIDAVAANITNVNAVAANETNINAVNTNKTNINTVAGKATEITTVAGIASDVSAVAAIASDVAAVEDIDDDVSAVAAIAVDVGVVADAATDVAAVADGITDVGTVATNISDVGAVASDITKIAAVADDLTNIDAVADDLTNIDNAVNYALEAEGFAVGEQNGVPVTSGSPYYQNNAKYYSQEVPALKNALTAVDHRVQNLEQPKGGYVVSNYKDGSITPSGKGNWAVVEGLRGVSRVENNAQYNGSFEDNDGWQNGTVSDGHIEGSANAGSYWQSYNNKNKPTIIEGHVYLVRAKLKAISGLASGTTTYNLRIKGTSSTNNAFSQYTTSIPNGTSVILTGLHTANANTSGTDVTLYWGVHNDTNNFTAQWEGLILTDLTLYFNGTIPSDADTIAKIQQNYPHLLTPSEYGTRIVDSSYSGVRAWARNLVDPSVITPNKYVDDGSGNLMSNSTYVASDYLPVVPNKTYYYKTDESRGRWGAWYDENKVYISGISGSGEKTAPSNAKYARVTGCTDNYLTTLCFSLSDSLDGTFTPYHAPQTLSLTFQGKSAGSVYDSCEPNVEVGGVAKKRETERVATVDCSTLTWNYNSTYDWWRAIYQSGVPFGTTTKNCLYKVGLNSNINNLMDGTDLGYCMNDINFSSNESIYIRNGSSTTPPDGLFYYEAPTPTVTLSDPLIDNTLLTESGGRMATVQTGTVVDGIADLGFITL